MASPTQWTRVWAPGVGDGQESLAYCSPRGHKELDTTERLNRTGASSGKESACQCRRHRRHRFDPWVRKIPWRRKWQPTLVFLLGKPQRQRSLAGYSPWSREESDMTEHACKDCFSCNVQVLRCCILIILQIEMFSDFN